NGGAPVTELFRARLDRAFAAEGLNAADHCVILGRLDQSRFGAAMGQCDVFLDSIGWSGCNSALESLPFNLPLVTLPVPLMRGLHVVAILQMIDVTDTVAGSIESYIATAARLANDPAARHALSRRVEQSKEKIYRDRACITALEDLIDRAARQR